MLRVKTTRETLEFNGFPNLILPTQVSACLEAEPGPQPNISKIKFKMKNDISNFHCYNP